MFCASCGTRVESGKFCPACGKPLGAAPAPVARPPVTAASVIHPSEQLWLNVLMVTSGLLWLGALVSVQGVVPLLGFVASTFVSIQMMASRNATHAIRVSERQLPELHAMYMRVAQRLGLSSPPPFFVQQQGGMLNAFAMRVAQRQQVVMTSTLLHEAGTDAAVVEFILGHELGHHVAHHTRFRRLVMTLPVAVTALLSPLLLVLKRKQEFTADRYGLLGCGSLSASERAMKLLMAGRYGLQASTEELQRQAAEANDIWHWLGEISTTHPNGVLRIAQLREFAAQMGMVEVTPPATAVAPAGVMQ